MKKIPHILLTGMIAGAMFFGGCNKSSPKKESIKNTTKTEISDSLGNKLGTKEETNKSKGIRDIAYFVFDNTKIYKDSTGTEALLDVPSGIFLRKGFINEDESNKKMLCIDINGNKGFIKRADLTKSSKEAQDEFYKGLSENVIIINKNERTMNIYKDHGETLVKSFKIVLSPGGNGGDKEVSGDCNTPEGRYYVCHKNPASSFGTNPKTGGNLGSLMISYPNTQDAWEGYIKGDIDKGMYTMIKSATRSKSIPAQGTTLGDYIMIHGGGNEGDWTLGCTAGDNEDIYRTYNNVPTGSDIIIW